MNLRRQGWGGLTVIVLFLAFPALMAAFIGTVLLFPGRLLESLWRFNPEGRTAFEKLGRFSSFLLFLVGAVAGGAAVGISRRHKWGWWFAVLLFAVNACGDAVNVLLTGRVMQGLSGVVISSLFLWYLVQPAVRRQFRD